MTRSTRAVLFLVALALAAPSLANAQGKSRGSSGGSSRGSGGTARSAPPPSAPRSAAPRTGASRPTSSSAPSRPSGTAVRSGPATTTTKSTTGATAGNRDRGGRPGTGTAAPRGDERNSRELLVIRSPFYGGWGWWDPWDSFGYGLGYGFGSRYGFGAFGRFAPFGYGYGYGSAGYGSRIGRNEPSGLTGSIRLRVNPSTAQVYIDGALAGTVDEFNGLTERLELEAGKHDLELRAAGYETYQTQITVSVGKTMTERATLKKK